jgi:serine protease SohB
MVVMACGAVLAFVAMLVSRQRLGFAPHLEVRPLHQRFERLGVVLEAEVAGKKVKKPKKKEEPRSTRVFVLDFEGDILATQTAALRDEVTALLGVAKAGDEVVVRLESPGGAVPHYGLAAAQLVRLVDAKLRLVACIDRVAASGGYLMAAVAQHIVAAPFATVGSIGVVAQVPNVHGLLRRFDVQVVELTAGEHKRPLSLVGEVTDKGKAKLQQQLDEVHERFKSFVKQHRPQVDIDVLATGEVWLAADALSKGLIDQVSTSDAYLVQRAKESDVFWVRYHPEQRLRDRMAFAFAALAEATVVRLVSRLWVQVR